MEVPVEVLLEAGLTPHAGRAAGKPGLHGHVDEQDEVGLAGRRSRVRSSDASWARSTPPP